MGQIKDLLIENKVYREEAQLWFTDERKREVSSKHDLRETTDIHTLSLNVFLSHYYNTFGVNPRSFLDVGCSTGETFSKLSSLINDKDLKLYGIDPSEDAIQISKSQFKNVDFFAIKAEELNKFKELFPPVDAVFIHLCLGLWDNPLKGINNLVQLMSDKSMIYIVDLHKDSFRKGIDAAVNQEEEAYLKAQYKAALTEDELEYILDDATSGFNDVYYLSGTGTFGGFAPSSMEFLNLINTPNVQRSVRSLSPKKSSESKNSSFQLSHGWIVKKSNSV